MKAVMWLWFGVGIAGCRTGELDLKGRTPVQKYEYGCGPNCPGNSPILAALGPFEASLKGEREPTRHWKLYPTFEKVGGEPSGDPSTHVAAPGVADTRRFPIAQFRVDGASLAGRWPSGRAMAPADFKNVYFRMNHTDEGDYEFKIDDIREVTYYLDHDSPSGTITGNPPAKPLPRIWAYHIQYYPVPEPGVSHSVVYKNLCPYTETPANNPALKGLDKELEANWVVFWKGDRYDPKTGIIYKSGSEVGDWFNMSCAGEAGIKMLRTGTGEAVAPGTSRQLRQTVLNMFMAKYCPSAERFTRLGTAIEWDGTAARTLQGSPLADKPEAIWSTNGAVCLDNYRDRKPTCNLRPCTGMSANWRAHGLLRSWIPRDEAAPL